MLENRYTRYSKLCINSLPMTNGSSSELTSSDTLFSETVLSFSSLWVTPDPDNVEMTKMVFDYSRYKNVTKINTGLFYEKNSRQKSGSLLSFTALRSWAWQTVLNLSKGAMRGQKKALHEKRSGKTE